MLQKASVATTQTALSLVVVVAFWVAVASETLTLLSQCFFHHSREAEGPCVATIRSRLVAVLVASSQSHAYFDLRLRKELDEGTRPH